MSARAFQSATAPMTQHRALICGVCLRIADRLGVPVWVPRAGFVVLTLSHNILGLLLYVAAAAVHHRRTGPAFVPAQPSPRARPTAYRSTAPWHPAGDSQSVRDRFDRLDARLAAMEAEAWQGEAALRRSFRDLDSK